MRSKHDSAPRLGFLLAFLQPLIAGITTESPRLAAETTTAQTAVGRGAAEPVSPASWYGEGVRPSEKRSPEEELAGFHLPEGFVAELIASEPEIAKPLNMAFDSKGKLWLTQTVEYPYPAKEGAIARDGVKTIEDTDGDGTFDRITTFADGLNVPIGILPYQQGAIVFSIPNILYLKDTDNDGVCDQRDVILGTFDTTRDTHGMVNALRRGDDGWIYACHGFNNQSVVKGRDGHEVKLTSGNTFRFRADGSRVELFTSGQVNPFGMSVDRYGNRITADCHSKPLTMLFPGACYPSFGRPDDGLGFFPSMMNHSHGSTAISGVALYDAAAFPDTYRDQIYSGNVMTSRINRDRIERNGCTLIAHEIEDFLTSDDPWFRPVDIQLGPDGALYVADFYNRIIGHYEVPLDHPGRDRDSGRIWRIRHRDIPQTSLHVGNQQFPLESLLGELTHDNISRRQLALDALTDIALNNEASQESLVTVAVNRLRSDHMLDQVGSLWFLHRLQRLRAEHLIPILQNAQPLVQSHALRAVFESSSIQEQNIDPLLLSEIRRSLHNESAEVRSWAAMALSRLGTPEDAKLLVSLIANHSADDPMLRARLRIALRDLIARHIDSLEELNHKALPTSEKLVYREILLGIHLPQVVQPIIEDLVQAKSIRESLPWIRHAVKYADESQLTQLIETLQTRYSDHERESDISPRELFNELQQATTGRSAPAMNAWVERFVMETLDAVQQAADKGQLPIIWTTNGNQAWNQERRNAKDQQNEFQYRSSLTLGESYTGVMRSDDFIANNNLSFWVVGHNGLPGQADLHLNKIRLVDSSTGAILLEAYPPRSDVAESVQWDLSAWNGKSVRIEVIDNHAGSAYAWIALGRFSLLELNHSQKDDDWNAALALIAERKIDSALAPLQRLANTPSMTPAYRLMAHRCLAGLANDNAKETAIALVLQFANQRAAQEHCLTIEASSVDQQNKKTAYKEVVKKLAVTLPHRGQIELARRLASHREVTPWLIEAWEDGWLSSSLLQDKSIETSLESTLSDEYRGRLDQIRQTIPTIDPETVAFTQTILATTTPGDITRGEGLFGKQCAICHQLGGVGSLIGPQLDGVGARGRERLLEDILFPDRNVDKAFRTVSLLMEDGSVRVGLLRSETPASIELVNNTGKTLTINATEVSSRRINGRSLMPDGHREALGTAGMVDLLTFLEAKASQKSSQ